MWSGCLVASDGPQEASTQQSRLTDWLQELQLRRENGINGAPWPIAFTIGGVRKDRIRRTGVQ